MQIYNIGVDNYNKQFGYQLGDSGYKEHIVNPFGNLPDYDWMRAITQLGKFVNADLSVSGGSKKTNYYIGASASTREGIIRTNSMNKINLSFKLNHKFNDWLEVGANNSANYVKNHQVPGHNSGAMIIGRAILQRPFDRPYAPDGSYFTGGTDALTYHNALQILNEEISYIENYRFIGSYYATLKFWEDKITFKNTVNTDVLALYDYTNYFSTHPYGEGVGLITDRNQTSINYSVESVLNYNDSFLDDDLTLNAMLGHSWYSYDYDPDKYIKTLGITAGIGTRLNWPDDYFTLYGQVAYLNYNLSNWSYFALTDGIANNFNISAVLSRNSLDQPIYPSKGSEISLSVALTPPYSAWDGVDYENATMQEKYKWIEYYKVKFKSKFFFPLTKDNKLVLMGRAEFGFLGYYNINKRSPFETFWVGGDGMSGYSSTYATETVALRGYQNGALTPYYDDGGQAGNIYTRFSIELRYPIVMKENTMVWVLAFAEAGNCWRDYQDFNPIDLKRSAGVGLRVFMPMFGLLGVDWAYGFDKVFGSSQYSGSHFHFILGQEF